MFTLRLSLLPLISFTLLAADPAGGTKPLIFNLDASEFFVGTFGPVTPKTLDEYVQSLSGTGVTDLFACVNMQRANFRSRVWEADWDGYDPKGGDNQPYFAGIAPERGFEREWYRYSYQWSTLNADYPARVLAAAKARGMRGWISIRMNDAHYPTRPLHPYHSTFWREHPEWHLENTSLDYARPEVRKHYMALIREVSERYDMEGLELDFMRHGLYFRPGAALEGGELMDAFVREARAVVKAASERRKHPVKLAVRVPTRPWISEQRGMNAVRWGRQGLVDLIVISPWWASSQSDVPVEEWRGLLRGTPVQVAAAIEDGISSGASKRRTMHVEETRGVALANLYRGADATYLFNWFTGPLVEWPKDAYRSLLVSGGSVSQLSAQPRRHPVTLVDPWADGEPGTPRPLAQPGTIQLRIPIGPAPKPTDLVEIAIGSSGEAPRSVSLNAQACASTGRDERLLLYSIKEGSARDGYNLVTIVPADGSTIDWTEIRIRPR